MLKIVIDGFAQAQRPPQAAIVPPLPPSMRKRHHVAMYTPADVRKWQVEAKFLATEQMQGKTPQAGMLEVDLRVYLPLPKSMPNKKRSWALSGAVRPITRPDCDNYAKSVCDSMSGVLWLDDAQIVQLNIGKWYSEKPRVEIEVRERAYPSGAPETITGDLFEDGK